MTKREDSTDADADADAFARAMADENVAPLARRSHTRVRATPPVHLPPLATPSVSRDAESDIDPQGGGDFAADGVDRREVKKLKRGDYPPAARYDLHGRTADAAAASVKQLLDASRRNGHRCISIVHGRGLRSPGGVAVLKARVRLLLRAHPAVLAFADAPRSDGGSGAVYVLLRRKA